MGDHKSCMTNAWWFASSAFDHGVYQTFQTNIAIIIIIIIIITTIFIVLSS